MVCFGASGAQSWYNFLCSSASVLKLQQIRAFRVSLFDCALTFNLGTFYRRDIRLWFTSVSMLQPRGAHYVSCILYLGFSLCYIRTLSF
jgi:hypothetical protein